MDLREHRDDAPQPVRRRPWHRLDANFVEAVRARYRADWRTVNTARDLRQMPWYGFGEIFSGTGECHVVAREGSPDLRRFQKLADAIGYTGPILGEVMS